MLAQPNTCGVAIAQKSPGVEIPEKGVPAVKVLDNMEDVHFGINHDGFNAKIANKALRGLGPRVLDIEKRGGRTAENTWRWLNEGCIPCYCELCDTDIEQIKIGGSDIVSHAGGVFYVIDWGGGNYAGVQTKASATLFNCPHCARDMKIVGYRDVGRKATPGFKAHFATFNQAKKPKREEFSAGAKISGEDVSNKRKYKPGATDKNEIDLDADWGGLQYGTRWSKAALQFVVDNKKGKIHFHLDGMGNVADILGKSGDYSHNVTSRELRYVHKNWAQFKDHVIFYNGYTAADEVVEVEQPW